MNMTECKKFMTKDEIDFFDKLILSIQNIRGREKTNKICPAVKTSVFNLSMRMVKMIEESKNV